VPTIAIALGSNVGDRRAALDSAITRLRAILDDMRVSAFIETAPEPPSAPDDTPYLNAVAIGRSSAPPRDLLQALLALEHDFGRERPYAGAPRTLDLDLILAGDEVVREPGLQVPHPRFRERRFVLEPLASIAPELVDPLTGLTIRELLERLPKSDIRPTMFD
jgi:2-amino-4-hydroxy-6-hydroxymethyldihydropteridine diphosphokinase